MQWNLEAALPHIQNEYEAAQYDAASGAAPAALKENIRSWMEANSALPTPLLFSGALELLLANCQIEINPYTPFAGKFNHGVIYRKDSASGGILEQLLNFHYRKALESTAPDAWHARQIGWDCGAACSDLDVWHVCPDWERLIHLGLAGIRREVHGHLTAGIIADEQKIFYQAVLQAYDAVLHLAKRMGEAAEKIGATHYAAALAHLTHAAPETLYQVLVLSRLYLNVQETGKERARTYGAVDQLWFPYYQCDIAAGRLTPAEAKEMIRFFLLQTAAEQRFADQPLCLGTVNPDGSEGNTDFALMILDAYDGLNIHNPKIHIRCAKNMNRALLLKALDMIRRGHNSIVLLHDEAVYAAYEEIGIPRALSIGYLPIGCYEPVLPSLEDARICSAWLNLGKAAEAALTGGESILQGTPAFGAKTPQTLPAFDDYLAAFYTQLRYLVDYACDGLDGLYADPGKAYAAPLLSGTLAACVKNGKDVFDNGMDIRNLSLKCFALATAVDSVLAVKELVYEKKLIDVPGLVAVLRRNWEGAEKLRLTVLNSRRKWGNHVEEADGLAKSIYDSIWAQIKDRPTANGGRYRLGCDSVGQADYGHRVGATPDGRLARALTSRNMRPNNGMEREGITALIQSVAQLDATRLVDAAPLDFWLHPTAVSGDDGLHAFAGLVDAFFSMGGFALHGNVLDTSMLADAQKHPENHPHLQIRVCGWNEYFVNLSKELQDDFIARGQGIEGTLVT